jgi:HlyD family secretion protein
MLDMRTYDLMATPLVYPGQVAKARVAAPAGNRGTVEVRLRVGDPPPFLRPDMTVSVNVEVGRRAGALVLPADALRESAAGEPWVLAVRGGRTERRPVAVGLKGEGLVEVRGGVAEGDVVVPTSALGVAAGQRVRARATRANGAELAHAG